MLAGGVVAASGRDGWPLFLWAIVQANFAILFIFLGLLGDQVRLISERTRGTPLVVEAERVNLPTRL
jgi:hypothetical protein